MAACVAYIAVHILILAFASLVVPATCWAHVGGSDASAAGWDMLVWALLAASLVAYFWGATTLWRKAGAGVGIRGWSVASFAAGWLAIVVSLSPWMDEVADQSFAVHMIQHEVLMIIAAPLLVLARPLETWAWAARGRVLATYSRLARQPVLKRVWHHATTPVGAWTLHAMALWLWHIPVAFRAALASPGVHVLQHSSFFVSALIYWWSAFGGRRREVSGASIVSLFTTMLHTSALGALLTFASTPWYYDPDEMRFGLSALQDQQLGGLIMWVPGGMTYVIAALVIVVRLLSHEAPRHTLIPARHGN